MNSILLLHVFLSYLTFHKLGTTITKNDAVLFVFSLTYAFSGAILSRLTNPGPLFALTWTPLVYYYFLKLTWQSEHTTKNITLFALSWTILFFTGFMYYVIFAAIVLLTFLAYYLLHGNLKLKKTVSLMLGSILFLLLVSIKLLPMMQISPFIVRIDPIDPFSGGGSFESNLASYVFGIPITGVYGWWEGNVLIGMFVTFLAIIGMIKGPGKLAIPGYLSLMVSFVWADGGNTLLSFIHLLPQLDNFRVPGRILGAAVPIVLLLALAGYGYVREAIERREPLGISTDQKKRIISGIFVIIFVKFLELPFQKPPSYESIISVILVASLLYIIYTEQATYSNLLMLSGSAIGIQLLISIKNFDVLEPLILAKVLVIGLIVAGIIFALDSTVRSNLKKNLPGIILLLNLLLVIMVNVSYIKEGNPSLDTSPAKDIIARMKEMPTGNVQMWVYDTGWAFQHMDFTYWYIQNGLHPMRAYYSYFLKDQPAPYYNIGNITYYTADWLVDTASQDNGQQSLSAYTFQVNNISVYRPEHILPNAFVVRNDEVINPSYKKFSPDEVIITGKFRRGDIAVLKTSYYPGWMVDGKDAGSVGNLVGNVIERDTDTIVFRFDPAAFRIGAALSFTGILMLAAMVLGRKKLDSYLANIEGRSRRTG
ncbi:MAG TPA: YfhO family protein [Candidatus Methanoperedenaceae archaeon]|nr:YfhO family protein [Candidatus Methanoperedenaceae archaeon]